MRCLSVMALASILCSACSTAPRSDLRFWLESMVWHHRFSVDEVVAATGLPRDEIERRLDDYDIDVTTRPKWSAATLKVLPYPGGRHPRTGFLDGAIDPHRDTKFSVFLPWDDAGYVVVDFPEALWSQLGLTYLAHTHIPTIWDKQNIELPRIDWRRLEDGRLESRRELPNGLVFEAEVVPQPGWVDMRLTLKNGTSVELTDLRTQICVLLKGAPGFDQQTNDNKVLMDRLAAVRSPDGGRWIVTIWERARPWANPPCPCMHSDPVFPDLAPGAEAVLHGRLFFYEGDDLPGEIDRRRRAGTLEWKPR